MSNQKVRVWVPGTRHRDIVLKALAPLDAAVLDAAEGAEIVALAVEDFKGLIENLNDLREDRDATRAYFQTRDQEAVPIDVADRLLAGENPVRVWREHRGIGLTALAQRVEISKSYLSQIETGERKGPVETMRQIANALGVEIDDLT